MRRLRLAHRLFAVTALITGTVTMFAGFTDRPMPHRTAFIWMAASVGFILIDRRMKKLVHRANETSEEFR